MNIIQLLNRSRIKKSLGSRIKQRDIFKTVYWLEFENECILKFLAKYDVIMNRQEIPSIDSEQIEIKDFVNLTHEPEFTILVEEVLDG